MGEGEETKKETEKEIDKLDYWFSFKNIIRNWERTFNEEISGSLKKAVMEGRIEIQNLIYDHLESKLAEVRAEVKGGDEEIRKYLDGKFNGLEDYVKNQVKQLKEENGLIKVRGDQLLALLESDLRDLTKDYGEKLELLKNETQGTKRLLESERRLNQERTDIYSKISGALDNSIRRLRDEIEAASKGLSEEQTGLVEKRVKKGLTEAFSVISPSGQREEELKVETEGQDTSVNPPGYKPDGN